MCIAGVNIRSLKFLIQSGALDSIIVNKNRKVYFEAAQTQLDSCRACYKKVSDKEGVDPYAYLRANWVAPIIEQGPNYDKLTILENEKELVGFYVSGHPLDDYKGILASNASTEIAEIDETIVASRNNTIDVAGQVQNFSLLRRKSDGKAMCKFTFMDLTGEIECICFTKTFEQFGALVTNNAIVKLVGYPEIETEETEEGTKVISKQFVVTAVSALSSPKTVFCMMDSIIDYVDALQPALEKLPFGNDKINVLIRTTKQYFETEYLVSVSNEFIREMKNKGITCHTERKD
jgi:DNA polymerase III alpha subunit